MVTIPAAGLASCFRPTIVSRILDDAAVDQTGRQLWTGLLPSCMVCPYLADSPQDRCHALPVSPSRSLPRPAPDRTGYVVSCGGIAIPRSLDKRCQRER